METRLPTPPNGNHSSTYPQNLPTDINQFNNHIILCGLRNKGYRILQQLLGAKQQVIVLDNQPNPRLAELAEDEGVLILRHDSSTRPGLYAAGVERAKAIIVVAADDLQNIETVLAVQSINPTLRTVVSFKNPIIGAQLMKNKPNIIVLNAEKLAAPSFITASLSRRVLHFFELEKTELVVANDIVDKGGRANEIYERLTLVMRRYKVLLPDGKTEQIISEPCPAPLVALQKGEEVSVIGTEAELVKKDELRLSIEQVASARHGNKSTTARKSNRLGIGDFLAGVWRDIDKPLQKVYIALGLTLLIFSIFFYILDLVLNNWDFSKADPISAFYLVLRTIGNNTDFGEIERYKASKIWLELIGAGLIIVGTAMLGIVYGYITNFIVSARLAQALGQQKATRTKDHIILVGLGAAGFEVLRSLVKEKGKKVVVLEKDPQNRFIALARSMGVPVVIADARLPEALDLVNVKDAECLTLMTDDDMANLEMAINARSRFSRDKLRIVMRLFDEDLADRSEDIFNISNVRSTSALVAPYFIAAALNFKTVTTFYVNRVPFFVAKLDIAAGSTFDGLIVKDAYTKAKVRVLAYWGAPVRRTSTMEDLIEVRPSVSPILHPKNDQILRAGDSIYCVGLCENLLVMHESNQPVNRAQSAENRE